MIANDPGAIIRCPLCDVPHEPSAKRCDACGQTMGVDVDVAAIRAELVARRRDIVFASVAIVGMVVANFAILSGAAIVALAPIGWLVRAVPRYAVLRRYLARRDAGAAPSEG